MTPREVFLLQFGKADDPGSGGRQMPSHYGHAGHRIFTSSSPVATQVLHAAGIALAAKLRGASEVALVVMGEGSSNQGDVHEALNFAGIHRLPDDPRRREQRLRDLGAGRARVGRSRHRGARRRLRDARAWWSTGPTSSPATWRRGRLSRRALAGEGPTFIEAKVMRLTGHSSDDEQSKYRSEEELVGAART